MSAVAFRMSIPQSKREKRQMHNIPFAKPAINWRGVWRRSCSLAAANSPAARIEAQKTKTGLVPVERLTMKILATKPPMPVRCALIFHHLLMIAVISVAIAMETMILMMKRGMAYLKSMIAQAKKLKEVTNIGSTLSSLLYIFTFEIMFICFSSMYEMRGRRMEKTMMMRKHTTMYDFGKKENKGSWNNSEMP